LIKLNAMQQVAFRAEWAAAGASTLLLVLSFPDFEFSFLAWIALVPLLVVIAQKPSPGRALILGWATGTVFFYVTCYWLTYSMIHYGGLPAPLAYLLLIPGALVIGIFPGLFTLFLALVIRKWGHMAVLLAPVFWTALEWARLGVTGQLWNAIGYSQAYHPMLIQPARWGGVYAVSFLILAINSAIALFIISRSRWTVVVPVSIVFMVLIVIWVSPLFVTPSKASQTSSVNVVALQPNVPMKFVKSVEETKELLERHWSMSTNALKNLPDDGLPRLVIWPESPMNFTYASDRGFQEQLATFAKDNRTSLLLNSLEPAPLNGFYNSALLINEEGRMISQYDKIRLMPFGEYVPLPQWLPGASLITGIVGDFTPGDKYTLMPFGEHRAGVFICIESAYPWIPRRLTNEGADVLINISNDGYLGPTAVMRQHLANAIFRAVENGRPVLRVTNSGLTALIYATGETQEQTSPFTMDVRVWKVAPTLTTGTFYTKHGDVFVYFCAAITVLVLLAMIFTRRRSFESTKIMLILIIL
jgi:apolipoprotein N-acyltransferase